MKYIGIVIGVFTVMLLQIEMRPKEYKPDDIVLVESVIMWNDKCSQHEKHYDRYITCESLKKVISEHLISYESHFKSN